MAMNLRRRARQAMAQGDFRSAVSEQTSALTPIHLEIGELVLRGIEVGDRNSLAETLERELALSLGEGEMTRTLRSGARERVDGGVIPLPANQSAPAIGRQIAQAVCRSLVEPMPNAGGTHSSKR
jgi:hypothetical protein